MTLYKFDKDTLLEDYEDDRDLLDKLIEDFTSKSKKILDNINKHYCSGNLKEMADAVHTLRGSVSIFYPIESNQLFETIEYKHSELSKDELKSHIDKLHKYISDLKGQLREI